MQIDLAEQVRDWLRARVASGDWGDVVAQDRITADIVVSWEPADLDQCRINVYPGSLDVAAETHRTVELSPVMAIGVAQKVTRSDGKPNHEALRGLSRLLVRISRELVHAGTIGDGLGCTRCTVQQPCDAEFVRDGIFHAMTVAQFSYSGDVA